MENTNNNRNQQGPRRHSNYSFNRGGFNNNRRPMHNSAPHNHPTGNKPPQNFVIGGGLHTNSATSAPASATVNASPASVSAPVAHNNNGPRPTGGRRSKSNRKPSLRSTIRQTRINKEAGKEKPADLPIPPVGNNIRFIPIGGVEEIGKNMTAIEIGDDIIVIDAGVQFSDHTTPGVDYIIPNTKYLEERKDKIRAMFITHGHLDHIGAIPYVLEKIGNPPMYARQFGAIMVQKKMEDFPHLPKIDMRIIEGDETIRVGNVSVETFPISHTIPDSMGLMIKTPYGDIVFIEDVRVDNRNGVVTEQENEQYKRFKDRKVLLLTLDSTSVEK